VVVHLNVFLTSTLDGVEWSALPPGKGPRYPLNTRLGGAPELGLPDTCQVQGRGHLERARVTKHVLTVIVSIPSL
jgi:hypothetical protein